MFVRDRNVDVYSPPRPQFYDDVDAPLSTKREKNFSSPFGSAMRQRARTAPQQRVYPRRFLLQRPQLITFKDVPSDCLLIESSEYNPNKKETFFDQLFITEKKLGEGSFGEVFQVYSKEDGCRYAVKRSIEPFRTSTDRQLKIKEVQKHELLPAHKNIVQFIKAWEERGRLYIQTELCAKSLWEYCSERHELPESDVWNYFIDILQAVHHLHSHDLLHSDIKPENILLTRDNVCKLGDFGLIFDLNEGRGTAEEGDSKYLAPEVLNGSPSKASDVFSMGITVLEVATDMDLPTRGLGWHQLREGRIPERFLKAMSVDLRRVVLWIISPDPNKRPTTAQLLTDPVIHKYRIKRNRSLQFINVRSSVCDYFHFGWIWVLALFHLIFSQLCLFVDALKCSKQKVASASTPYKAFSPGLVPPRTPENALQAEDVAVRTGTAADWSFSDDEDHLSRNRLPLLSQTPSSTQKRNAAVHLSTHHMMNDPHPIYRLNFDDETTSSSSDSFENLCVPMKTNNTNKGKPPAFPKELSKQFRPSPLSPSRYMNKNRNRNRETSVEASGDYSPIFFKLSDNSDDDTSFRVERASSMTCPARMPLRTKLRNQTQRRKPRLDLELLSEKSESPPVEMSEKRKTRLASRKMADNSVEE